MTTKSIIKELSEIILKNDKAVKKSSGLIMKKEGVVFKQERKFKYGIEATNSRVTLHLMPMYANPAIREQYLKKLKDYSFAKGCIRLKPDDEVHTELLSKLIVACPKIKFPCK